MKRIKNLLLGLALPVVTFAAQAQAFLVPTNPAPQVKLVWNASGSPNVTNYFVYYGIGSGQYTNKFAVGNLTNALITLPVRGVQFFYAVTAQAVGLESQFSNEVSYSAPIPPSAPSMQPLVVLVVQWAPNPAGAFADTGMNWATPSDQDAAVYRLRINKGYAFTSVQPPLPSGMKLRR